MTKAQRAAVQPQQPGGGARGDGRAGVVDHRIQHLDLDLRRRDAGQLDHVARLGRQRRDARQDRFAHRRRQRLGVAGQQLGDEERVALRHLVEAARAAAGTPRHLGDAGARQRRQRHADAAARRQPREHAQQRVIAAERVVAIAQDEQRARAFDAPAQVAQQIERRAIGPLRIVDHQDGGLGRIAQHREHAREHLGGMAPRAHRSGQRGRHAIEPIDQGSQRRRRQHRLAGPPQPVDAAVRSSSGSTQHGGLADSGLSTQQHASSGRAAGAQCGEALAEGRQLGVALEQQIVRRARDRFDEPGCMRDAVHAQEEASC